MSISVFLEKGVASHNSKDRPGQDGPSNMRRNRQCLARNSHLGNNRRVLKDSEFRCSSPGKPIV